MDNLFQLEIGSWTNLKGHAVIYWNAKSYGETVIVAINFCVSAFPFEGNLIATTFPMSYFYSREEFMFYIQRSSVDLISLGEIEFSDENIKKQDLTQLQYKQLNKTMEYYLAVFKTKIDDKLGNLTSKEKIELTRTWLNHLQKQKGHSNRMNSSSIKMQIQNLLYDLEEDSISHKDIDNFILVMNSRKRKKYQILSLYLQKFLAILSEEYEQVIAIKNEIESLN